MVELFERVKTYLSFSRQELLDLLLGALVLGFVFSFRDWGFGKFSIAVLIALLSILFHVVSQKIIALKVGFHAEYKIWWTGLGIAMILAFISNGSTWWILVPGGVSFSLMAGLRLGRSRYGLNYFPMGMVGLVGAISSIVLATIFKSIDLWFLGGSSVIFNSIFIFNLAYAVGSMLPIPPLDGHYLFYSSRLWYVFLFVTVVTYTVLSISFGIYSWIFALIAGGIAWLSFYIGAERGWR